MSLKNKTVPTRRTAGHTNGEISRLRLPSLSYGLWWTVIGGARYISPTWRLSAVSSSTPAISCVFPPIHSAAMINKVHVFIFSLLAVASCQQVLQNEPQVKIIFKYLFTIIIDTRIYVRIWNKFWNQVYRRKLQTI